MQKYFLIVSLVSITLQRNVISYNMYNVQSILNAMLLDVIKFSQSILC